MELAYRPLEISPHAPVTHKDFRDPFATTRLPRVTVLVDKSGIDAADAIGELNAFDTTTLDVEDDIQRIHDTRPSVVAVVIDDSAELIAICKRLLMSKLTVPLIILSRDIDPFREALLLEMGAKDVIFIDRSQHVTVARIRAVMRTPVVQIKSEEDASVLKFGRLEIDMGSRSVRFSSREIQISTTEFDSLWVLALNAGQPVRREELQRDARGFLSPEASRFVDYRIHRLRRRLSAETGVSERIRTVRLSGYMFATSDW